MIFLQSYRAGLLAFAVVSGTARLSPALESDSAVKTAPTFCKDVVPILQKHCQECHRPGQIAPMSLLSYEDARPWVKSIREQVAKHVMPPWPAAGGVRAYSNDRSLDDREIALLSSWVESGAPKGEEKDLPAPIKFNEGWTLGEPDKVVGMDQAYQVAGEGRDDYRCFVLDPGLTEDRWVNEVEILPGNRQIDHHIVLYVDRKGTVGSQRDAKDSKPGYECFGGPGFQASQLAGWGPGLCPKVYPKGTGYQIPAGGKIVMQVHYHRNGKPASDQTRVGLHFAKEPIHKALRDGIAINFRLNIPAGDANHVVEASHPIHEDITIYSIAPHMHLLGKSAEMWAELPDGKRVDLVAVPHWDFNWQTEYSLVEPLHLPTGSKVMIRTVFDNSAENPAQPVKPPKDVTFGEETTDEMCVGVYFYTRDREAIAAN